jgi:hypothetical protein
LIIVKAKDVALHREVALEKQRQKLLKQTWLTYAQVLKLEMLPINSKSGLENWVKNKTIREAAVATDGRGVRRILTSEIKRLANIN